MSRQSWKPIYFKTGFIFKKNKNSNRFDRNSTILKEWVNLEIKVYNGLRFFNLKIKKNMVGYKLGSFIPTRKKPIFKQKK